MKAEVHILRAGWVERDDEGIVLEASSTVSLVTSGSRRVVVDTAMPHDAPDILEALADQGLGTEDVDMVVNTHGHHDHTGCNHLFGRADVVLHRAEGAHRPTGGGVVRVEGDADLVDHVRLIETPGHTRGHISVVVDTDEGAWVMAGEALPTYDNFVAMVPPNINYDPEVALASMRRIIDLAWMIVPGHGEPFLKAGVIPPGFIQQLY